MAFLLSCCATVLSADDLCTSDDLITQYLKQHNRASLAADADAFAKQTLSTEQIERIIATDQKETALARRLVHWRVLHEAQSPTAHDYLRKALIAADPGQAIEFLQSLRFLRGQDIPLLTTLYEQTKSDLMQNVLVSISQADPRTLNGSDVLLTKPPGYRNDDAFDKKYREYEELASKAIFLYQQWLVANAKNVEHRRAVYISVCPYDHISFLHDGLRCETDVSVRRTIYEVLVGRNPGTGLLRLLNSDEPESTKLACMKLSLLEIRTWRTRRGTLPNSLSPAFSDALRDMELGSPALVKMKAELIEASSLSTPDK